MRCGRVLPLLGMIPLLAACAASPGQDTYSVGRSPIAIAIGDVNGDGRPDVVTANAGNNTVTVLLQNTRGVFDTRWTLTLPRGGTPTAVATGLFSSTSRADIVVAEQGTDTLEVFEKPKNGSKPTREIHLAHGAAPSALATADFNKDGYTDLGVTTHRPEGIGCVVDGCVLFFDGSAGGLTPQLNSVGLGTDANATYDPTSLAFGPFFSGDSVDLAVADAASNRVLWIPAQGPGSFAVDPSTFHTTQYTHPTQVVAAGPFALIGGGSSCVWASAASGRLDFTGYTLCIPQVSTGLANFIGGWNPTDGSARLLDIAMGLDNRYPASPFLTGATTVAVGKLLGGSDAVFAVPSRNAVALFLGESTWQSSTTKLTFDATAVGKNETKTFTAVVGGEGPWPFTATLSGADASQFSFVNAGTYQCHTSSQQASPLTWCCPPSQSCTFTVAFTPSSTGQKSATLTLRDDQADGDFGMMGGPVVIPLAGKGTPGRGTSPPGSGSGGGGTTADEPAPSPAGQPFAVGVTDDAGKFAEDRGAAVYSDVRDLGMGLVRETVLWHGESSIAQSQTNENAFLDRSLPTALAKGVHVILAIYPADPTSHDPTAFCQFAKSVVDRYDTPQYGVTEYVIGNEPNQDAFWQPQVDASGTSLSAPTYEDMLSTCYRLIKPAHPDATIAGAALNTNGTDATGSHTSTSPVKFIQGMAAEYKHNGETGPIMDVFAFHAYPLLDEHRVYSPAYGYGTPNAGIPNLGRLRAAFDQAFAGTAQPLFRTGLLHFLIDEVGWQTTIPPNEAAAYTGTENGRVVDPVTQAAYDKRVIDGFACDGSVAQLLLFHLIDENQLASSATSGGWQSGLEYANRDHKPSYDVVKAEVPKGRAACDARAFVKP